MDNFDFINVAINQLFTNNGLHQYLIYVISIFGFIICYRSVTMWLRK